MIGGILYIILYVVILGLNVILAIRTKHNGRWINVIGAIFMLIMLFFIKWDVLFNWNSY